MHYVHLNKQREEWVALMGALGYGNVLDSVVRAWGHEITEYHQQIFDIRLMNPRANTDWLKLWE